MAHSGGAHHLHHFKSAEHQFETSKNGMWLFLLQEVLFFSPLFVAYAIFRMMYPADFHLAAKELSWVMGALNTVFLVSSSFTMARAVTSIQLGKKDKSFWYLVATIVFACGFLVVKYFEYTHKFHVGTLPGKYFSNPELLAEAPKAPLFFSLYFAMTGLHGIHVLGGIGVLVWITYRVRRGDFGPHYFTHVEMTGLYWHFVDLVWIYLFPLLYLVG